jgi:hypothetical protein
VTPTARWLPYELADLEGETRSWTVRLGLSQVDGWESGGDSGAVLRAPVWSEW